MVRVDYYLMLNNIEIEDLGIEREEFTVVKKKKFISNSNAKLLEGTKIIKEIFLVLSVSIRMTTLTSRKILVIRN